MPSRHRSSGRPCRPACATTDHSHVPYPSVWNSHHRSEPFAPSKVNRVGSIRSTGIARPSARSLTRAATSSERAARVRATQSWNRSAEATSPTFPAYRGYAWLRDGSFTAEGVSRYGDVASADRFHDWVARTLAARSDEVAALVRDRAEGRAIPVERMLPTRFTFDGANGSDLWWEFQTDGYGTWLWSVVAHAGRHGLPLDRWRDGIAVATAYLVAFWDLPCYDWWEEHVEQQHVSTLGPGSTWASTTPTS